ncbi:membrane dipeptidase [candidate division KSB1 bacterium]|nr:membrane dipeptidase [candidate division KSB1 bacterium]
MRQNSMKKVLITLFSIFFISMIACNQGEKTPEYSDILHQRILTIDTHCDTPLRMADTTWDVGARHEPGLRGSGKVDLPRMKEGGLDVEFFAAFVAQRERTPENNQEALEKADKLIRSIKDMCIKYSEKIQLGLSPDDAYEHEKQGLLTAFIGIENGFAIGQDISNIHRYYDMGARYITLCHTKNNDICDSSNDSTEHGGLSDFGAEVVQEMNRIGMIVDVSHISDEAFFDVLETTTAPVIASHSSVRAICDNVRNLSDDMLKALAENGGVIQICIYTEYVKKPKPNPEREQALAALREKYGPWEDVKDPEIKKQYRNEYYDIREKYPVEKATVADVVDHIDHVVELIGIDHVGIGTDFDGGGGVIGCDDVSEMSNITRELVRRGYSDKDIEKIWGGNFMRVFREVRGHKAANL